MRTQANRFFDWASTSPPSRAVWEAQRALIDSCFDTVDAPTWQREQIVALTSLRDVVRQFVHAPPEAEVVVGRSVSELMTSLANGLRAPKRSRVLVADNCHPAAILPWLNRSDLRTELFPAPGDLIDDAELSCRLARDVLAVVTSDVTHRAGRRQHIAAMRASACNHGAVLIVDGAQAVGRVTVDYDNWENFIYIGSGRKALMAPVGTAFMVAKRSLLQNVASLVISPRSSAMRMTVAGRRVEHRTLPERLEGNLPDLAALAGLRAAIEAAQRRDSSTFDDRMRSTTQALLGGLGSCPGISVDHGGLGIVLINMPKELDAFAIERAIRALGFVVAAAEGELRVSIHEANSPADAAELSEALVSNINFAR